MRRLLLLALLGCASSGSSPSSGSTPFPDRVVLTDERGRVYRTPDTGVGAAEQEVPATTRDAVEALVGVYGAVGIDVNQLDWNNGRVGARNFPAPRRLEGKSLGTYLDCGTTSVGQPRANNYAVTMHIESVVRPGSTGNVVLTTLTSGTARQQGVSSDPINCTTTGYLERRINLLAAERLATK